MSIWPGPLLDATEQLHAPPTSPRDAPAPPPPDVGDDDRRASAAAAVSRLWGEGSGYDTLLPDTGFEAGSFSVWRTPVEDVSLASWQRIAEFELTGEGTTAAPGAT